MPPPRSPEGRSGPAGEALAAAALARAGYRVVARNLRTREGEIDLLARRRRTWIAVEVKTRRDHPAPERAVDAARLDRLSRALSLLSPVLRPRPRALRIDVVAVRWGPSGPTEVLHFPAVRAWAAGPAPGGLWRRPEAGCYAWPIPGARPASIRGWIAGCLRRWTAAVRARWRIRGCPPTPPR